MIGLARFLREKGHDVAFCFEQRSHNLHQSIDEAVAEGFLVFGKRKEPRKDVKKQPAAARKQSLLAKLPVFLKRLIAEIKSVRLIQKNFGDIVERFQPAVLIVPACSAGYNVPVYAAQSRKLNVKVICLPFAIGDKDATQKAIRFAPKSSPEYLLNKFFKSLFEKWYLASAEGDYPVLPAEMLVAYRLSGIDVTFPLSFYGTRVEKLLLENEYMLIHARNQLLDAHSVEVTGSIFDDDLALARQDRKSHYEKLCNRLSWDASRRMICVALPPLINDKDSNSRFFDFSTLMEKFIPKECDFAHVNVLVSLHPRINPDLVKSYQCADNIRLLPEPVEGFIPLSDLFVSTYSSTIRTAIALRIPVVNYDLLNFDYELFRDLPGVAHVRDASGYCDTLSDFVAEGARSRELAEQLKTSNLLSSTLDGRSKERILNAITLTS